MDIFFTSDTHFGHFNAIRHNARPFTTLEEMDEHLIENWNNIVKGGDTVYHLGDFAWRNHLKYKTRLKGKIFLIRGNHDKMNKETYRNFTGVYDLREIKIDKKRIILCHYPLRFWNASCHGSWHLHGHIHRGCYLEQGLALNVGVDDWHYKPISWDGVVSIMSIWEEKYRGKFENHHKDRKTC